MKLIPHVQWEKLSLAHFGTPMAENAVLIAALCSQVIVYF
jgi:hypothetical protein